MDRSDLQPRDSESPKEASYFRNTTRPDRHRTTRFLENKRHSQRDRHLTTVSKLLLIPRRGWPDLERRPRCNCHLVFPTVAPITNGKEDQLDVQTQRILDLLHDLKGVSFIKSFSNTLSNAGDFVRSRMDVDGTRPQCFNTRANSTKQLRTEKIGMACKKSGVRVPLPPSSMS